MSHVDKLRASLCDLQRDAKTRAMGAKIRRLAYEITEKLKSLADVLEQADLETSNPSGPLIDEHLIVCEAMEVFSKQSLTKIL